MCHDYIMRILKTKIILCMLCISIVSVESAVGTSNMPTRNQPSYREFSVKINDDESVIKITIPSAGNHINTSTQPETVIPIFNKASVLNGLRGIVIPELCELSYNEREIIPSNTWFSHPGNKVLTVTEKPIVFEIHRNEGKVDGEFSAFFSTPVILEDPQLVKQLGQRIMGALMLKLQADPNNIDCAADHRVLLNEMIGTPRQEAGITKSTFIIPEQDTSTMTAKEIATLSEDGLIFSQDSDEGGFCISAKRTGPDNGCEMIHAFLSSFDFKHIRNESGRSIFELKGSDHVCIKYMPYDELFVVDTESGDTVTPKWYNVLYQIKELSDILAEIIPGQVQDVL